MTLLTNPARQAIQSLGLGNISVALGALFMLGEAAFILDYGRKFLPFVIDAFCTIYNLTMVEKQYKEAAASSLALVCANFLALISASTILTQAKSATPIIDLSPAALDFLTLMLAYSSVAANTPAAMKALDAFFTTIVSFIFGNAKSDPVDFMKKVAEILRLEERLQDPSAPAPTVKEAQPVASKQRASKVQSVIKSMGLSKEDENLLIKSVSAETCPLLLESNIPKATLTRTGYVKFEGLTRPFQAKFGKRTGGIPSQGSVNEP